MDTILRVLFYLIVAAFIIGCSKSDYPHVSRGDQVKIAVAGVGIVNATFVKETDSTVIIYGGKGEVSLPKSKIISIAK